MRLWVDGRTYRGGGRCRGGGGGVASACCLGGEGHGGVAVAAACCSSSLLLCLLAAGTLLLGGRPRLGAQGRDGACACGGGGRVVREWVVVVVVVPKEWESFWSLGRGGRDVSPQLASSSSMTPARLVRAHPAPHPTLHTQLKSALAGGPCAALWWWGACVWARGGMSVCGSFLEVVQAHDPLPHYFLSSSSA